jgi:hypothetical protein
MIVEVTAQNALAKTRIEPVDGGVRSRVTIELDIWGIGIVMPVVRTPGRNPLGAPSPVSWPRAMLGPWTIGRT